MHNAAEVTQNEARARYLRAELQVWTDRRNRATCNGNKDLVALYVCPEMDAALGAMRAELYRLEEEANFDTPHAVQRGCGGRRRVRAQN